jgi:site-specific recombinase XerD
MQKPPCASQKQKGVFFGMFQISKMQKYRNRFRRRNKKHTIGRKKMKNQAEKFILNLKAKNFSPHTLIAYKKDISCFLLFAHKRKKTQTKDFDKTQIRAYLSYLQTLGLARNTVLRKIAVLRSFTVFLTERGLIKTNPFKLLPLPKREKLLPHFLSEKELQKMISAGPASARDLAMTELLYSSGLRRNELVSLNAGDIDFYGGIVRVMGKGLKERIIPVTDNALEAIKNYLNERKISPQAGEPLFLNKNGRRLSGHGLSLILKKISVKTNAGKKITPHEIRHSFATHMLNHGCDLRSLQEMLGHKNPSTTQIYTHVSLKQLKKVYDKSHPRGEGKT